MKNAMHAYIYSCVFPSMSLSTDCVFQMIFIYSILFTPQPKIANGLVVSG